MQIVVLAENAPASPEFEAEHGLSFYVATKARRFLFDFGASDLFLRNATRLGVDVSAADVAFLSHGHRDHSGGLAAFLEINAKAQVFAAETAFQSYFSLRPNGVFADIGTKIAPERENRIVRTPRGTTRLDAETLLFSDVETVEPELRSEANDALFERVETPVDAIKSEKSAQTAPVPRFEYRRDRFLHEQNLIATTESGRKILIIGCAHRGIVAIMRRCVEILGAAPDVAIGGFHLTIPSRGETIPTPTLDAIAERLAAWPTRYFTGHCAGRAAFERVRRTLGDQIEYFGAGSRFEF